MYKLQKRKNGHEQNMLETIEFLGRVKWMQREWERQRMLQYKLKFGWGQQTKSIPLKTKPIFFSFLNEKYNWKLVTMFAVYAVFFLHIFQCFFGSHWTFGLLLSFFAMYRSIVADL